MFKIKKIILNSVDIYEFKSDYTLVYGPNNVGKSVLVYVLDYMLGSSGEIRGKNIWKMQGLDNVFSIEMVLDLGRDLFLKRTPNELYYKYNESDDYILVDINGYKELLQSSLIDNYSMFDEYTQVVNEKLNYRGFSYLNIIDQYALGNVTNIFPESVDYRYVKRLRKQMLFLFDSLLLKELNKKEHEKQKIDNEISKLSTLVHKRDYILSSLNENINYLNIKNPDSIDEKRNAFNMFMKNIKDTTNNPINKELVYLLNASNQLSSQLEIEKTFSKQKEMINTRNKKIDLLVNLLSNYIGDNENYSNYKSSINDLLVRNKTEVDILSLKDYSTSIDKIRKKKEEIDKEILLIKNSLKDKNSDDISRAIRLVEYYFDELMKIGNIPNYEELQIKSKALAEDISELKNKLGNSKSQMLNDYLTEKYINFDNSLSFVNDDKRINGFSLEFIPNKMSIIGKQIKKKNEEEFIIDYMPGSKARQTCWQVLSYIGIHMYIHREFSNLPLMPILIIDGINEPFDEKFQTAFNCLVNICIDNDIQLIATSTMKIHDENKMLDISNGLNSAHKIERTS